MNPLSLILGLDGGKQALSRLQNLQLQARTVAEGALSGLHKAAHHGASVEFAEHKEYAPGDDLRHIDWRAYGRMDKFYVKRFDEETELRGHLLLDASGSMGYGRKGQHSKLDYGKVLCAALGYLLLRQKDHVGLLSYGGERHLYLPPRGQGGHLADLCQTLLGVSASGHSDLPRALDYLSERMRRRSLMVVVSDLFPSPGTLGQRLPFLSALSGLRARRHDVIVLHTLDPDELELPFEGPTWFEDMEDAPKDGGGERRRLLCDPADVRKVYQTELARFLAETKRGLQESDVEYHLVPTSRPPQEALLDVLQGPLRGKLRR